MWGCLILECIFPLKGWKPRGGWLQDSSRVFCSKIRALWQLSCKKKKKDWIEPDNWLCCSGICRSDVWANLLFVKGNSSEGGGPGSRRKNAANVELAWHFYACREPCVASARAGDSEWWPDSNCNRQQRKPKEGHANRYRGGYVSPPAKGYSPWFTFVSHLF